MTLVPVHDLVKCPEYWYESLYHATLTTFGTCCLNCCLTGYFLNIHYTLKLKNIANITFIAILLVNSIVLATYYIWTAALEYQYPIPFLGIALFCLMTFPFCIMIWFNFVESKYSFVILMSWNFFEKYVLINVESSLSQC